ncbi:unnamed protein product [Sordaria macrospora k-hell]|uniref:WGS project CABT00000000 data, contig 2.86 n=2 Tax=Sordaria macrospora TaxID=5147 RepID=F7WBV7_SORMK|nr:uncharacterized protein SMAC_09347 [Sordaria macrospora k-hell]KAH7625162.1 hypothetical protein B0T09DRAFT_274374 [Sordaria sp. MPI-SDFR-AT-0083]CCC05501.1 unnamed protein product [Sordaria macrospora k-hell]
MFSKTTFLSLLAPLALQCLVMVHAQGGGLFDLPPDVVCQLTHQPCPSPFISVPPLKKIRDDVGNDDGGELNVPTTLVTAVRPDKTSVLLVLEREAEGESEA